MTLYCSPGVKCENIKDERQWTPNNTLGFRTHILSNKYISDLSWAKA
jgi:hypothetical protein